MEGNVFAFFAISAFLLSVIEANVGNCSLRCNIYEMPNIDCTRCICKPNFINLYGLGCDACARCIKPMVMLQQCSDEARTNTVCDYCPKGTFYDNARCKNCTTCTMAVKTLCTKKTDTVCAQLKPFTQNYIITKWKNITKVIYKDKQDSTYGYLFWISVSVNIILALIFLWRSQRNKYLDASSLVTNSASSLLPKMKTLDDLTTQERALYIRDLTGDLFESLGKLLNPQAPNNWKTLAGRLSYSQNDIANFGLIVSGGHAEYTQNLLTSWGSRNCGTVGHLGRALIAIRRDDAFLELYNHVVRLRSSGDDTSVFTVDVEESDNSSRGSIV